MSLKILVKRDSVSNFIAINFIPRKGELVAAYDTEGCRVIFKIGDGQTPWDNLNEITKISELGTFCIYTNRNRVPTVEMFLDPFRIAEVLTENTEDEARVTYEA